MGCEAEPRPKLRPMGWKCKGAGLVQLLPGSSAGTPPVVCPRWAVEFLMAEPCAEAYAPRDFPGGDHLHAVVQRGVEVAAVVDAVEADVPAGFVSQR